MRRPIGASPSTRVSSSFCSWVNTTVPVVACVVGRTECSFVTHGAAAAAGRTLRVPGFLVTLRGRTGKGTFRADDIFENAGSVIEITGVSVGVPTVPHHSGSLVADERTTRTSRMEHHMSAPPDSTASSNDALAGTLERTEVQREQSSIPGRDIVQVLTKIPCGVQSGW